MKKLIVSAFAVALALVAGAAEVNLNITNYLAATSITSWPTNSYNTNGNPQLTGGPVGVYQQEHYGFNFQCFASSSNATVMAFGLVGSMANNAPQVSRGTNIYSAGNTVDLQNDWQSIATGYAPTWVVFTIPVGTNWFNFQTNFVPTAINLPDVNYVGVYQITNNVVGSNFFTNTAAYINKKLIPTPLIGQ